MSPAGSWRGRRHVEVPEDVQVPRSGVARVRAARRTAPRLRDIQKQQREDSIVASAARLFADNGFDATSIEQIADGAGLAVGTVYNYFSNKTSLLLRIVLRGRAETVEAAGRALVDPPADPVDAVCRLLLLQLHGATRHDKRLWRVVQSIMIRDPEAFGREYADTLIEIRNQIGDLLALLQERGDIRADVELREAAEVIGALSTHVFRRFCSDDEMPFAAIEKQLLPKVAVVVRGLLPVSRPS